MHLIGAVNLFFAQTALKEMPGWDFDSQAVGKTLSQYQSSLYWLAIIMVAIFILGTQLVFFPMFYRGFGQQASGAMRLSYLMSFLVAVFVFHWWLWHVLFVALTHNYWLWLVWALLAIAWIALVIAVPKRRLES